MDADVGVAQRRGAARIQLNPPAPGLACPILDTRVRPRVLTGTKTEHKPLWIAGDAGLGPIPRHAVLDIELIVIEN